MARHVRTALALGALLGITGCKQDNPNSCDLDVNRDKPECQGIDVDAPEQCEQACVAPLDICLMGNCVECVTNADCTTNANEPVCNNQNACVGCGAHEDCASDVCLPDGSCAADADVAYVQGGATGDCSKATPCGLVSEGLDTGRAIVKVNASATNIVEPNTIVIDGDTVTIVAAPGTKLESNSSGFVFEIKGAGVDVAMSDLHLVGKATNGDGIRFAAAGAGTLEKLRLERMIVSGMGGFGINATSTSADELTIRRSIFQGNDSGGGTIQTLKLEISNSLFVQNGDPASATTGLIVNGTQGSVFEFNTVADNAGNLAPKNLACITMLPVKSSILTGPSSTGATCAVSFSLFSVGEPLPVSGANNRNGDPMFQNTTNVTSPDFYRIGAASEARDNADPAATQPDDIDGADTRPRGGGRDIGADEAPQ